MHTKHMVFAISLFFLLSCDSLISLSQDIPEQFERMGQNSRVIRFTNPLPLNENGGHLQGVQFLGSGKDAFVLSGSSSSYAYYLKLAENEVQQVEEIDQIPFKHAGGFQLADGYLAVGIEDNSAKDKSKVLIYQAQGDEIQSKPTWIIDRVGEVMRSTAGCIGIARQKDQILVVVGDWDTKHLDFYQINAMPGSESPKAPFLSLSTADLNKESWINPDWHSYQNINLLQDKNGALYLVGLGTNNENQNVADLFEVSLKNGNYGLKKISSKLFQSDSEVSFRAGAGMSLDPSGKLMIVACGNHIGKEGKVQVWE